MQASIDSTSRVRHAAEVGQGAHLVLILNGESGDAVLRSTADLIQ
jgi:hypothetical protein